MEKRSATTSFLAPSKVIFVWCVLFLSLLVLTTAGASKTIEQWLNPAKLTVKLQEHLQSTINALPTQLLQSEFQSEAKTFVDAIHGNTDDKAFFLYRLDQGRLVLQAQTATVEGYLPNAILANHTSELKNWVEIRRILIANEQPIGLLIGVGKRQSIDTQFIVLLLSLAFILSIVICKLLISHLNKTVLNQSEPLLKETNLIIDKSSYDKRLATKKFGGFELLAGAINSLFKKIDKLKKQYEEIEETNSKLLHDMESKIEERTNALRVAMEEAERANESKSTFLATMSHEIRTPMNGIIGSIDLLRNGNLNQNQYRLSETIRESAFSLLRIIDDILDFSKIEAGKLEVESVPLSINAIIEAVGRTLMSVAQQKSVSLRIYCDPALQEGLLGDPIRIRQILFNLAGNAIKFTNSSREEIGVVQIRAEVGETNMEFTNVVLRIIDNGKGMTQRQVNYVFQPFSQAEGSVTRQFGGTGLGLTICQRLTDLMYGQINVKSDLGEGSEFSVTLPLRPHGDHAEEETLDLSTTDAVIFTPDHYHGSALDNYTRFFGSKNTVVHSIDSLLHIAEHYRADSKKQSLWIIDATEYHDDTFDVLQQLLEHENCGNCRFLVLTNTIDFQDMESDRVWLLHALPLCRTSLLEALKDVKENKKVQTSDQQKAEQPTPISTAMSVEDARASHQLVLLAEDNAMNQQVITEQLNMLGYAVEVANDGQEAIDMWRVNHYPLVLTDLHMPNKSGYDVVKTIRKEAMHLPKDAGFTRVVAITANALKGEEQKCISLGMDGYLTKPLELPDLESVMKKWLDLSQEPSIEVQAAVAKPTNGNKKLVSPIQQSVLISYLGNDTERHKKYLDMFKNRGNELIDQISVFVKNQERENIKNFAHQFKSMSKSVGAIPLHDSALEMESTALTADMAELDQLFKTILKQFNEVIGFVKENYAA